MELFRKIIFSAIVASISSVSAAATYTVEFSGKLSGYSATGADYGLINGVSTITGRFNFNVTNEIAAKGSVVYAPNWINAEIDQIAVFGKQPAGMPSTFYDADGMDVIDSSNSQPFDKISLIDRSSAFRYSCPASFCKQVKLLGYDPITKVDYGLKLAPDYLSSATIGHALSVMQTNDLVLSAIDYMPRVFFEYKYGGINLSGTVDLTKMVGAPAPVPLPASAYLLFTSIAGLFWFKRREKRRK